jgi:hypothetical protein
MEFMRTITLKSAVWIPAPLYSLLHDTGASKRVSDGLNMQYI